MMLDAVKRMADNAAAYRVLQELHINAALTLAEGFRDSDENEAEALGEKAAELEVAVLKALAMQPRPVCPHCYDRDDEEAHAALQSLGASSMLAECGECGGLYVATGKAVTLWTTRKYPG